MNLMSERFGDMIWETKIECAERTIELTGHDFSMSLV